MNRHRHWLPRPQATVRGRLLCLLLLAALPVLAMALLGTHAFWRSALEQAERQVAIERDMAVTMNRAAIEAADAMLRGLALALAVRPEACAELLAQAGRPGLALQVVDMAGEPRCSSAEPPRTPPSQWLPPLLASAEGRIQAGSGATILVARSLGASGGIVGAAAAELPVQPPSREMLLWLLDEAGHAHPLGAAATLGALAWQAGQDVLETTAADGTALIAAAGRLAPGLNLLVATPATPAQHAAGTVALQRLLEIGALLALSMAAVMLGLRYAVTRPLLRLREAVAQWRAGTPSPELPGSGDMPEELRDLAEAFRNGAAALAAQETELRAALDRAELLTAEVHHRVKNNLQVVSSLLALQGSRVTDPAARAEFEAARDRVGALATLHRHMYIHHDPEAIDLGAFIDELGAQLFASVGERPGRRITLEVAAPSLRIASDQAVPLTLIITEAISSALKLGFPGARRGRITIRLDASERRAHLTIEDDGEHPRAEDPLRAMLLRGLGRQLGGELQTEDGRITVEFPLRAPLPRHPVPVRPPAQPAPPAPSARA